MKENSQAPIRENELSKIILDAAFRVHSKTGRGLLETVYEVILAHELRKVCVWNVKCQFRLDTTN